MASLCDCVFIRKRTRVRHRSRVTNANINRVCARRTTAEAAFSETGPRLISLVTAIKPGTEPICRSARHKESGEQGEYTPYRSRYCTNRIKPIYCYTRTTPRDTISYAEGIRERVISLASLALGIPPRIRPALNLVRGFVRSPFSLLIPDPVARSPVVGSRPNVAAPDPPENHDNYYVRANRASPIDRRWVVLVRHPRARDRDTRSWSL